MKPRNINSCESGRKHVNIVCMAVLNKCIKTKKTRTHSDPQSDGIYPQSDGTTEKLNKTLKEGYIYS